MERLRQLFRQPAFHVLLFCVFLALFGWPFLTIAGYTQGGIIFYYLFLAWGTCIFLSFMIARSVKDENSGRTRDKEGGE